MKIGITGSNGFIGKHLSEELKKQGIEVLSFNLPPNNLLNPQEKNLKKFIKGSKIIIHLAAINRGTDSEVISGSVVATYNLIATMKKYKSQAKLIFLSSIQAETNTLYGQSKKLSEIMIESFSRENHFPVTVLRLTNVFGGGCKPFYNSVVATFCHQITHNKKLTIYPESKNRKMNLVYIDDVVKMVVREIFNKRKKPFYFKKVSTKNEITIGDLAKLISSFKGKKTIKLKNSFQKKLYKTYLSYL